MRIKLKRQGVLGFNRSDDRVNVDNIILKEDLLNPDKEHIAVFLKGEGISGIINIGLEEARTLGELADRKRRIMGDIEIIRSGDRIPVIQKRKGRRNIKKRK